MARSHPRPESPAPTANGKTRANKKRKNNKHEPATAAATTAIPKDASANFYAGLLEAASAKKLHDDYVESKPFKHVVVDHLFRDDLLVKVKDEIISQLVFTEKETDIYKVHQTGDLASLSYLSADQLAVLPSLLTLRDALYSPPFRSFVRSVTGCGALSGSKQDMSVNTYRHGCHLLNHDDVIGSRRVSYILYMPLPHEEPWKPEWGGALELYETRPAAEEEGGGLEPEPSPCKAIPPSWNQFIFFEVQPGRSFHSVEEVVVGQGEDGRQRLSISGWFHAAQEGEEGYDPTPVVEMKSSREQLTSSFTPLKPYPAILTPPDPTSSLSESHISFLSEFLNPVYLQARTLSALGQRFVQESSLELHSFLAQPLADKLDAGLRSADAQAGLGPSRPSRIPAHSAGEGGGWTLKGPPHKWRYCVLPEVDAHGDGSGRGSPAMTASPRAALDAAPALLRTLQDELFSAPAFRAWLALVTRLVPTAHATEARRFRPGLDYTLATAHTGEARLDAVLGLTPEVCEKKKKKGKRKREEEENLWERGEWGGWECYMAPHEEEDDPAVYRVGGAKQNGKAKKSEEKNEEEEEEDDSGTLLTVQPGFNRLLLVLRDEGVMRFVKYVSAAAQGSRWDVCGEYEVGMVEEDDSE